MGHVDHSHSPISIETDRRQFNPTLPKPSGGKCFYFVASNQFVQIRESEISLQQPSFCIHLQVVT